jgi:hypothetical protein
MILTRVDICRKEGKEAQTEPAPPRRESECVCGIIGYSWGKYAAFMLPETCNGPGTLHQDAQELVMSIRVGQSVM